MGATRPQPPEMPEFREGVMQRLASDEADLIAHLRELDIVPLLLVHTHLTGDESWLDRLAPHIKGAWSFEVEAPEALCEELRQSAARVFRDYAASNRPLPPAPSPELLQRMCDVGVGGRMPPEYLDMVREELNFDRGSAKTVHWRKQPSPEELQRHNVVVIGAGFAGLAMAHHLRQAGIPFVVIEKNDGVGGTWYENTYPGVAVDTPNHFYSYSFRMEPEWEHYFATGGEILKYIRDCYEEMDIAGNLRLGEEVVAAVWDKARAVWKVTVRRKDGLEYKITANAVISASGLLNRPSYPDIPGMDRFKGPMFHSSRWDHSIDLAGKRVALIGTGASGAQVGIAIAPKVGKLVVCQRTPHWFRPNRLIFQKVEPGVKWGLANIPFYNKWYRFLLLWATADGVLPTLRKDPDWPEPKTSLNAQNKFWRDWLIDHMREQLDGDEEMLARITPDFPPYGKRMLRDGGWFRTLKRDNVELVTGPIREITETGLIDDNGVFHEVDMIVLATGFHAKAPLYPMNIVGANGSIRDHWGEDNPRAHLGITVPEFPNLFLIYGPNTNGGHGGSALFTAESQIRYIMLALRELIERGAAWMEVREEPYLEYNRQVDAEHAQLVWTHGGVNNWYKNRQGRVVTNLPWTLSKYRNLTAHLNTDEYVFGQAGEAGAPAAKEPAAAD